MKEDVKYPYIIFKVEDSLYCVNSEHIVSIMSLPNFDSLASAPKDIVGMFNYYGRVIQLFDLRSKFGIKSILEECKEFDEMIDARKQDHINWTNTLEQSFKNDLPFTLARDHHQCALGKWYDKFMAENTNNIVKFQLRKIENPHRILHSMADKLDYYKNDYTGQQKDEHVKDIFNYIKKDCVPEILGSLEEIKSLFRSNVFRETVLVLQKINFGIIVDEIVSVEDLVMVDTLENDISVKQSAYVSNVFESKKFEGLIFELNTSALFEDIEVVI